MAFITVAVSKLNALIDREDFVKISSVNLIETGALITIEFKDRTCTIDSFGKVHWQHQKQ